MPFHFNMQKVLDYRRQLEEQASVALAQALRAHDREAARLEAIEAELAAREEQLYAHLVEDSGERWLLESFIKGLRADAASSRMRLKTLARMVAEAREALRQRALEHKVLDRLRERQQAQYLREEREKERKVNDETATLRRKASTLQDLPLALGALPAEAVPFGRVDAGRVHSRPADARGRVLSGCADRATRAGD